MNITLHAFSKTDNSPQDGQGGGFSHIIHSNLKPLLLLTFALLPVAAQAQSPDPVGGRQTTHATVVGIGAAHQLETYLSPLSYRGPQVMVLHETLRATRWAQGRVSLQTLWQAEFSSTQNAPAKARYLGGSVGYDVAWHYHWQPVPRLRLLLGPQVGTRIGFLYNTRNGNNPAQAIPDIHLSASAAALCDFRLWGQPLTARYQLDLPLVGAKFSPNYGQSYYEIFSLGHGDHNVCVTHPFNAFSSRHMLTLDIPFRRTTMRAGYLCEIRQSHVNEISYHHYTHAFIIGVVRHLTINAPRWGERASARVKREEGGALRE
ncbi:MAG: DUF3316 domain-containing protein [Bacteroidales bacterium]|nr:DUF3316 domain-containing protein [Bacteroidales bacterium]